MGRPKSHDEHTGEQLLDEAERLLAAGGPEAVSLRAVADAAGTTTRAVYSVFGGKDGLLEGLATRGYGMLAARVTGVRATDDAAGDLVAAGLHGFRRFALDAPHLFRLTFERISPSLTQVASVSAAARASYEALAVRIRRAQAVGAVDGALSEIEIAFAFHSLCQGLASGELSRAPPPLGASFWRATAGIAGEDLWRTALTALVRGLAPPAEPAPPPAPPRAPRPRQR